MPQNLDGATYTHIHVERTRAYASGLVAMPVAGPDPQTQVFARCHAPCTTESIRFGVIREGAPPAVPSPEMQNSNYVLLSSVISAIVPIPLPGGAKAYSVCGTYVFALRDARLPQAQFPLGKLPYHDDAADSEFIPVMSFRSDLLGQNE